jgi:hypothetical protein
MGTVGTPVWSAPIQCYFLLNFPLNPIQCQFDAFHIPEKYFCFLPIVEHANKYKKCKMVESISAVSSFVDGRF